MSFRLGIQNNFQLSQRNLRVRRIALELEETLEEQLLDYPVDGEDNPDLTTAGTFELDGNGSGEVLELSVDDPETETVVSSKIELPLDVPFNILPGDVGLITVVPGTDRNTLKIPAGLPTWKVEVMSPVQPDPEAGVLLASYDRTGDGGDPNVSAGDDEPGG